MRTQQSWLCLGAAALALQAVVAGPIGVHACVPSGAGATQLHPTSIQLKPEIQNLLDDAGRLLKDRKFDAAILAAQAALTAAKNNRKQVTEAAGRTYNLAIELDTAGAPTAARTLLLTTLSIYQQIDPQSLDTARSMNSLGVISRRLGDTNSGLDYYGRALKIREEKAPGSMDLAITLGNLGQATLSQRKLIAAQGYFQRALRIQEEKASGSLEVAMSLTYLGVVAHLRDDLTQAQALNQRALRIFEEKAPASLHVATNLNNLGNVAYRRGELSAARDFHQRALKIREERAPASLEVAASLMSLGVVARDQGELTAASDFLLRALKVREEQAPGSLDVANTLHRLGFVAFDLGNLSASRSFHQRALDIRKLKAPGSLDMAASLYNLGMVTRHQNDLTAARVFLQQALKIEDDTAPGSLAVAKSLKSLGSVAYDQGDLAAARDYLQRALKIQGEKGPDSLDVADGLGRLGVIASDQGNFRAARELHRRALMIQQTTAPDSLSVAATLSNLGLASHEQGDLVAARDLYLRALSIEDKLEQGSLQATVSLNNLGVVAFDQGDLTAAQTFYTRALNIQQDRQPDSIEVAASLSNLGSVAREQGDLTSAQTLYQRALRIESELAPNSLAVAISLSNLGLVASARGDLTEAQGLHQRALRICESGAPGSLDVAMNLKHLGDISRDRLDVAAARSLYQRAWLLVQTQSRQVTGDEARRAFQDYYRDLASSLERTFLQLGDADNALRTVEEGRAQALQQSLSERVLERTASPEGMKRYREALNRERIARAAHARAISRQGEFRSVPVDETPKLKSATQVALSALTQARVASEAAWAEVKRTSPRGALADPMPFPRARASLKPGEIYLAYSIGDKESTLYLAPAGNQPVMTFTLKLGEKDLQQRVNAFTREVTDPGADPDDLRKRGRALAMSLLPAPTVAAIRSARRVILSPNGPLWDVPWSALVLPTGEKREPYLGLAKPLLFAQSLSLHARTMSAAPSLGRAGTTLALGGCLFDASQVAEAKKKPVPSPLKAGIQLAARGPREILRNDLGDGNWKPLPATGPEAQSIAGLYGAKPVTGIDATETEVRKRLAGAKVVHFATHGRYFAGDPLLSGIILTAPASGDAVTPETDGVLEAAEVLDPALKINADVVVLSACGTGRGKRERAEGLVGLVRCWQIAGARSVVASQWSVADASTGRLMTAFHKGLKAGLPKDEAMRRAMAELAAHPETAHPFHWAPFLVTGDPRPMGLAGADGKAGMAGMERNRKR